jgi:hypothetical protein
MEEMMTHEEINIKVELITEIVEKLFGLQTSEQELLKRIMETVQGGQSQLYDLDRRLLALEEVANVHV